MRYKKLTEPGWLIAIVAVHCIWTAVTADVRCSVAAAPSLVADNQSGAPLATSTISEASQQCRLTSISRACNVLDQPIFAFGRSPKIEAYNGRASWGGGRHDKQSVVERRAVTCPISFCMFGCFR